MINFNNGEEQLNKFLGSEKKTTILYDNKLYMLKYPDPIRIKKRKDGLSYKNNQYSEHIGSSIFRACGFEAQETVMGYFTDATGKEKIVVGCKDFTQDGGTLYELSKLAKQITKSDKKLGATIENVALIINSSQLIKNKETIIDSFWDMFVIDAFIGNGDRHFENWGILEHNGEIRFAPIYDCSSALGAPLEEDEMEKLMIVSDHFKNKEYNISSCYNMEGKRIFYHEIFKNPPDKLTEAIKRIVPRIKMAEIYSIVDSVSQMSEIRKEYLKKALMLRYEQILLAALKRIWQKEKENS
ncbi:MAG: HipA domain-containing protein [Clostridiales bacterium]|jgi:hypothetical protein|nr:HipA domain-containing protein [Clostridiales bacterium]MDR2712520.1 HipA domain-containing protein [Clostridiales bacterium]